jgi:2-keto-3-deoxy-L-rhamnonate aldolase RhmA
MRLAEGSVPLGMQSLSGSPVLVEIIGRAGFDFVMLDTEHASVDQSQLEALVRAADAASLTALVRVAANDPMLIRKALEAGACGVVIPQVRSVVEVASAVDAARFPPAGSRGSCVAVRGTGYSIEGWDDYARWTNEHVYVIPIIEHPDAIAAAKEICELDGVELVLFGPGDLGLALGLGVNGMNHPRVQSLLDQLIDDATASGTRVMCVPFPDLSADACRSLVERGVAVLLHSVDALLFAHVCREIRHELTPLLERSPVESDA